MKRFIIFSCLVGLLMFGCQDWSASRATVVRRFQMAYPENWRQKLLEYDIEQERLHRDFLLRYYEILQSRPPIDYSTLHPIPLEMPEWPEQDSTYWQEQRARQEYFDRWPWKIEQE